MYVPEIFLFIMTESGSKTWSFRALHILLIKPLVSVLINTDLQLYKIIINLGDILP
jgi:hypothetical protein